MSEKQPKPVDVDLDNILKEGGIFGKYQFFYYILLLFPVVFTSMHSDNYIFATPDVDYRCKVDICEDSGGEFEPHWLENAIPKDERCQMYNVANVSVLFSKINNSTCPEDLFNKFETVTCDEYVYKEEYSFIEEMGIECEGFKRTLIGTMHSVGTLIALPITGYLSDRYGRKVVLVISCALESILGIIKSFSVNYWMYFSFELLEPSIGSGVYVAAYVLALELLVPKHRALGGAIINMSFAIGQISMAAIALGVPYWRNYLRAIYAPLIIFVVYHWLLDDSNRWLLGKKRYQKVVDNVKKIARINRKTLSDECMEGLLYNAQNEATFKENEIKKDDEKKQPSAYMQVLKSKMLVGRLIKCSFWWITCTFCFYGLSINAVALAGNVYTNYMLFAVAEFPAHILSIFGVNIIGRKWTLFISFVIGGLSLLAFAFLPEDLDLDWLSMLIYFLSKLFVTAAFNSIYLYTSELFPTTLRQSLMSFCSMVGRIGSILAPQTPLLTVYMKQLPSILFGSTCMISALLTLFSPETLHLRLPETIEEAENMESLRIQKDKS